MADISVRILKGNRFHPSGSDEEVFNEKTIYIGVGRAKGTNRDGDVPSGKLLPPLGRKGWRRR